MTTFAQDVTAGLDNSGTNWGEIICLAIIFGLGFLLGRWI